MRIKNAFFSSLVVPLLTVFLTPHFPGEMCERNKKKNQHHAIRLILKVRSDPMLSLFFSSLLGVALSSPNNEHPPSPPHSKFREKEKNFPPPVKRRLDIEELLCFKPDLPSGKFCIPKVPNCAHFKALSL